MSTDAVIMPTSRGAVLMSGERLPTCDIGGDTCPLVDPDIQQQEALLSIFLVTVQHFFRGLNSLFQPVKDPRDPLHIIYPLPALLTAGLLLFVFRLGARRQIKALLRGNGPSAAKFQALFGVADCPHGDTLNATFARLDPEDVQHVLTGMVEALIRAKVLYPHRLFDRYFLIAIDGTGMLTFSRRHCSHCLTQTRGDRTIYYHPVLEAKLVTATGFVFSLLTEFIENPDQHPSKQDCELKAFYRLAERLARRFPRLPICLILDGLYAVGPTLTRCEDYRWKYIITLQEDSIPSLNEDFQALTQLLPENHLRVRTGCQNRIKQDFRWVNHIAYVDSETNAHTLAVVECLETKPDPGGRSKCTRFKWITNFTVHYNCVVTLANQGGRPRWKIENEGFNVQKNGGFELEHAYTRNLTASKVFYLLLQMAHTLAQLIERSSLFRRAFSAGVGSAKNIALRLLEAWRNLRVSAQQIQNMLDVRCQIRFAPP
jgi:hypothetical protein